MTYDEVMKELKTMGSEQSKKVLIKHGAREPFYGVKVADLKSKLVKKIKKNYELSLELYDSGNSDAMYLAGLISEPKKMTKEQLYHWASNAYWYMISEYTVAWVAAESEFGWELGLEWIDSETEQIAAAGWSTLTWVLAITPDDELDFVQIEQLMERIEKQVHTSQNRVRYTMNGFVIGVGSYVIPLNPEAKKFAESIGKVKVEMGGTACKVPFAPEYIKKVEFMGRAGKKRKRAIC